jgi:Tol biopolymer transport system component
LDYGPPCHYTWRLQDMNLAVGARLGPYEVVAPIGAGGMGEVYRARDTRLDRTVAIKVLPVVLAGDPEFRARFEREAKSISALNHPNICTLHDVGRQDDMDFLVMEFLEGETLADRLTKGPLPVDEALDVASQIADALDKAHRQGIIHRDLKPANVFLARGSGAPVAKLLDFGLAKMGVAASPGSIETRLLTTPPGSRTTPVGTNQGTPLTTQGSILGTFQYMSPEQIEGQEADARTDIWGFGCLLYEMLTGRRAFEGRSQASLIASILERQPAPIGELQPLTPPALGRLVRTCLEKNPDNRFHTAHDLWLHLQWIDEGGSAAGLPAPVVAGRKRRERAMFAGGALGLAALAALGAWSLKPAPITPQVVGRFSYALPEGIDFTRAGRQNVAISPDGTTIAFVANQQIYLRRIGELDAQPIRGTNLDPLDLTFSPDGQSIAFMAPSTLTGDLATSSLKRVSIAGGAVQTVCQAGTSYGVRWQGHRILFSLGTSIQAVAESGGKPETLVSVPTGSLETMAQPQLVNDGRDIIYTLRPQGGQFADGQIVIQPVGGGARRTLINGGLHGWLTTTGHLIYVHQNTLFAQMLNSSLEAVGGPVPVVEGVNYVGGTGVAKMAVSDTGTLVYLPGTGDGAAEFVWVDRQGREEKLGAPPQAYVAPRLSPDGTRVVAFSTEGDQDIWIWDTVRRTPGKLTSGPDSDTSPIWVDDRQIIFRSNPGGVVDLFRRFADGTGTIERLSNTPAAETPYSVLKDGRVLLAQSPPGSTAPVLQAVTFGGQPEPKLDVLIPDLSVRQVNGEISPDGRWLAYQSPEGSTRDEIHVRPFPKTGSGHWQISTEGGQRPLWARSGKELFYIVPNKGLTAVPVQSSPTDSAFKHGPAQVLFNVSKYRHVAFARTYDVSPDDQRFVFVTPVAASADARPAITIVTNWFDDLRARVK